MNCKYYIDYIETNGKRPTSLEVQAIEQQYAVQALAADGKPEFVNLRNQLYPNAENPFKKSERQLYQEKIQGLDLNREVPAGSFGIGSTKDDDMIKEGKVPFVSPFKHENVWILLIVEYKKTELWLKN